MKNKAEKIENQRGNVVLPCVSCSFFKCKANDYSTYEKGKIYHREVIGKYLIKNPKDWVSVLDYPTSKELLECLENGTNKAKIIKSLKQLVKLPLTFRVLPIVGHYTTNV